ncbi:MAG: tripartite tricarboxylate transporter TctB family protein [Proteobacteria bacterium]|nr:tripartite tricarboxylate transporter TctB family protein [Pseudomonadota bacterium]
MGRDRTWLPLGISCIILGLAAIAIARDYPYGSVTAMGPGFIPTAVSILLIFFGALILAGRGRDVPESADGGEIAAPAFSPEGPWRAIGSITVSIVLFGMSIKPLGLPITAFLVVLVAGYAHSQMRIWPLLTLAVLLSAAATLVFIGLLGLNIGTLPRVG